jgi:hypothetical protein
MQKISPSLILSLALALILWIAFFPGFYSRDSLDMIHEAQTGHFYDFHSLILPLLLAGTLKAGGDIPLFLLGQCLAGFLGLRRFIRALLDFFSGLAVQREGLTSLLILLTASPLTPFSIYMLTYWTDPWLASLLLWSGALLLELGESGLTRRSLMIKVSAIGVLITLAMLIRQNAIVLAPFLAGAFALGLRRIQVPPRLAIILSVSPLILYAGLRAYLWFGLKVAQVDPAHAVYALDLSSMIVEDPAVCQDLSIRSCDLVQASFPRDFLPGNGAIDLTLNQGSPPHDFFVQLYDQPSLKSDYLEAAQRFPLPLIHVKWVNFLDYLRPDSARYFYPGQIPPNDMGLVSNTQFGPQRSAWLAFSGFVIHNGVLRWFSFVHAPWLALNILAIVACAVYGYRTDVSYLFLGALLLIPLAYYASYLLALTTSEFRFMYPATLLVQVISIGWLASQVPSSQQAVAALPPANL